MAIPRPDVNRVALPRVFLAAPMTDIFASPKKPHSKGIMRFVKGLTAALRGAGHQAFSAHHVEAFGLAPRRETVFTPFDYLEVRHADVIVAFPGVSGGVHTELGWASALRKPILLLTSGRESPLARGLSALTSVHEIPVSVNFPRDLLEADDVCRQVLQVLQSYPSIARTRHVAFAATAFGFGPVAKAVAIAQEFRLRDPAARLDFFGAGIDHDFAVKSELFDHVIRLDMDNTTDIDDFVIHSAMYDDIISILNFAIAERWDPRRGRLHVVDSLAWMWPTPPAGVQNATHYFVQRYLVPENRLAAWGRTLPVVAVEPICRSYRSTTVAAVAGRTLLVNLSGCANPLVPKAVYMRYAITLARWIIQESQDIFGHLTICVQNDIAVAIRGAVEFSCQTEVGHLSPDEFSRRLAEASCILTSPGITTTLELLSAGRRAGFLLAQNYSQALLNERNRLLYPSTVSMAFGLLGPEFRVPEGLPEPEGVALVIRLLERVLSEKEQWGRAQIRAMLRLTGESWPASHFGRGQEAIVAEIIGSAPLAEGAAESGKPQRVGP